MNKDRSTRALTNLYFFQHFCHLHMTSLVILAQIFHEKVSYSDGCIEGETICLQFCMDR